MGSISLEDVERLMSKREACIDSRIWYRQLRPHVTEPEELWHALIRPDWRWWVLSQVGVSLERIRAYLIDVTWRMTRGAYALHTQGFTGFPVSEILGLLTDPKVRHGGDQRSYLAQLAFGRTGTRIGKDSFHYGLIEACENLTHSVLKPDEEYGYLKHVAVNLQYAASSARLSDVPFDPDDVRDPFGWPELQDTITSSDFFNDNSPA